MSDVLSPWFAGHGGPLTFLYTSVGAPARGVQAAWRSAQTPSEPGAWVPIGTLDAAGACISAIDPVRALFQLRLTSPLEPAGLVFSFARPCIERSLTVEVTPEDVRRGTVHGVGAAFPTRGVMGIRLVTEAGTVDFDSIQPTLRFLDRGGGWTEWQPPPPCAPDGDGLDVPFESAPDFADLAEIGVRIGSPGALRIRALIRVTAP